MNKQPFATDLRIIILVFVASRIMLHLAGVHMDPGVLLRYWQYLDVETLRHHLMKGVWYDHTQPPVFNLLLGFVLKVSGNHSGIVFSTLFKLMTLINTFLLLTVLKATIKNKYLPIIISLLYLLSPATMLFENELFYTSFVTLLLLTSTLFIIKLQKKITYTNAIGFFIPLIVICLTRSMYHLLWLTIICLVVFLYIRKKESIKIFLCFYILSLLLTGGWYIKNKIIFDTFSTSSWMGMNIARNVFHDTEIKDSSLIEAIEPFSRISAYNKFLSGDYNKYKNLNDRDLLMEMKNDSFINEKHAGYLELSKKYMEASKKQIKAAPLAYLKNVFQSSVIFFAPGTRYPSTEYLAAKIKYYDIIYSFNVTHFASGKQERRVAMVVSALPKILRYLIVFGLLFKITLQSRKLLLIHLFITSIIAYIFFVSSFFEHYENMRFRYEAEPLFLILAAFVIDFYLSKRLAKKQTLNTSK